MSRKKLSMFDKALLAPALVDTLRKLDPRAQWRNPVMFVVYIGSIITTAMWAHSLRGGVDAPSSFILSISIWLWLTVLFANFAEALAEGRGKAQAASLRKATTSTMARLMKATTESRVTAASL